MEIEISPATPEKEWSPGPEVNSDFFIPNILLTCLLDELFPELQVGT